MFLRNDLLPESFGIHPWIVSTLYGTRYLVVGFGIAGAVTVIEQVIGEIPIFNILMRLVLTPSQS